MIQRITIGNFKSFRNAELPLASPLTLLVGAHASGKSNAIEAIRLLAWLGSGQRLEDVPEEIRLRRALNDLSYSDGRIFLGCEILSSRNTLVFSTTLQDGPAGLRVASERLAGPLGTLHERPAPTGLEVHEARAAYGEDTAASSRLGREVAAFREEMENVLFLSPIPPRMRDYSFPEETRVQGDGSNLSSVLYRLCREGREQEILGIVRSIPELSIQGISFLHGPRGEVMLELQESFGGSAVPRDASMLSEGTLRVLALGAALLSVAPGSLVVLEEIENLHPSGARPLLDKVLQVARKRNLKILLVTDNAALMDAIPLSTILDTVACYRDPDEGDSRLVRLEDLECHPELVSQGPLGQLVTWGIFDRHLKVKELRDRELRIQKGLAWFEEFEKLA